jgi:hypothetical protein
MLARSIAVTTVLRLGSVVIRPSAASRTSASRTGVRDVEKRSERRASSSGSPGAIANSRMSRFSAS